MKSYKISMLSFVLMKISYLPSRKLEKKNFQKYVIEFEANLKENLLKLQFELQTFTYQPSPIKTFVVRDPKTRKISASHFRDRVVHHALCNLITPIFEKGFIHDSFANRKGKGTHNAINRFEQFLRETTFNHQIFEERERALKRSYWLRTKSRHKHYFQSVDHNILLEKIRVKIKDEKIIWLIEIILKNHKTENPQRGMPLGNLTSQFFANIYLDEFDHFVKQQLKAKYYLRYVDDFVILHISQKVLVKWKTKIEEFFEKNLR